MKKLKKLELQNALLSSEETKRILGGFSAYDYANPGTCDSCTVSCKIAMR